MPISHAKAKGSQLQENWHINNVLPDNSTGLTQHFIAVFSMPTGINVQIILSFLK